MPIKFDWDPRKARRNLRKHGIDFDEASTVFADTLSITIPDPDPSEDEERWVTMGLDALGRVLVVVYTWRGENPRLISARNATKRERERYEEPDEA